MRTAKWPYAVTGLVAAAAGAGVGHLVAGFIEPAASPVLAVGSAVIDATPTPVKEWAVSTFGTADKPLLIGGVTGGALALMALAGLLMRRSRVTGMLLLIALAAVAGWAAVARPAAGQYAIVPALVTGLVGLAVAHVLLGLVSAARSWRDRAIDGPGPLAPASAPVSVTDTRAGVARPAPSVTALTPATGAPVTATRDAPSPAADPHTDVRSHGGRSRDSRPQDGGPAPVNGPVRRDFLLAAAGFAVLAGAGAIAGQVVARPPAPLAAARPLPKAVNPLPPVVTGLESRFAGITPLYVPNNDFYRIDTALVVPRVDPEEWTLTIDGDVENPFTITWAELLRMDMVEADITLTCVSNEVGGPYVGGARWRGVPVRTLLERAQVRETADQILSTSVDGMTISTPVQALTDDRDALLAVAMNGEPLPREHGYPVRMVTPGLYGFVGSTKWVTRLTATTYDADPAYWTERGWAIDGTILTQARIDTPRPATQVAAGEAVIGGVAWAQHRGIDRVEVQIDDGQWQEATFGPDAGIDMWRQWYLPWDATPGRHFLTVRATDAAGSTQPEDRADPFPRGATGWHRIVVTVE